jgi:hypothetical protein
MIDKSALPDGHDLYVLYSCDQSGISASAKRKRFLRLLRSPLTG